MAAPALPDSPPALSAREFLDSCVREKIFPGYSLGILTKGKSEFVSGGHETDDPRSAAVGAHTVYDVASITKAIPTAALALMLVEQGKLGLAQPLCDVVPEFRGPCRGEIRISHLLTHTLDFDFRLSDKKNLPPAEILGAIFNARLRSPPGTVYCYANASSVLLGLAVERAGGARLDKLAHARFFAPLGMRRTTFFPEALEAASIAPAEVDPWRGRVIRGEVHDESAWALRPAVIAGSAGLFSTAPDLLIFLEMLLCKGERGGRRYLLPATVRLMHTNALPASMGVSAALGWELDAERFMGKHRGASTFGKTGFTGCAIVADPVLQRGFVFLTNHTFPRRRESNDRINAVRSRLADTILGDSA